MLHVSATCVLEAAQPGPTVAVSYFSPYGPREVLHRLHALVGKEAPTARQHTHLRSQTATMPTVNNTSAR